MTKYIAVGIPAAILLIAIGAFIWPMLAALSMNGGLGAVIIMIVACFAVGGVLIFLLLYSARKGYDDGAKLAAPPAADLAGSDADERQP